MFAERSQIEIRRGFAAGYQLMCKEPPGLTRRQRLKRRRLLRKQVLKYQIAMQREWQAMMDRLILQSFQKAMLAHFSE